jgi:nitroreductase
VADAPLAIVVAVVKSSKFALSDASRAIQSMMLAAWTDGVGSNWVGFSGMDEVRTLVKAPASLDVVAIVPFGYPVRPIGKGRKQRKPVREVVHRERYGQPFA